MRTLPPWDRFETDLRIALVVVADACRYMLDMNDRGSKAAAAILGMRQVPDGQLDDLIEQGFLDSVVLTNTTLYSAARRCFEFVATSHDLNKIDVEMEEIEGARWLSYFCSLIPGMALGGRDYSGLFHHPDAPIPTLANAAFAKLALVEFVQGLLNRDMIGLGFTPRNIAELGDLDVRSVRNAMGPKGNRPIRTLKEGGRAADGSDFVEGDPLDSLEWLAGRRGFDVGRIPSDWVNDAMTRIADKRIAAALPGVVAWVNRRTTEKVAKESGLEVHVAKAWMRGKITEVGIAGRIADASGIDRKGYEKLIRRVFAA
jgi:hypothetical protein